MRIIGTGRTAEVFLTEDGKALKLFRPGFESSMPQEYEASAHIAQMNVLAPQVYGTLEIDGRPGILYENIPGTSMLSWIQQSPHRLPEYAAQLAHLHLRIHAARPDASFPEIKAWLGARIRTDTGLTSAAHRAALACLDTLPDGSSLLHMDLHPDNILGTPQNPAVIDWNNAARGAPGPDVCRTLLMLSASQTADISPAAQAELGAFRQMGAKAYLDTYLAQSSLPQGAILAWMLPVAAARLADSIANETAALHGLIAREMQRPL